jgi:hypothetical protein
VPELKQSEGGTLNLSVRGLDSDNSTALRALALKALDSRLANTGAANPRQGRTDRLGSSSRTAPTAATASAAAQTTPSSATQTGNGAINSRISVEQAKGKAKATEEAS